MSNTIQSLKMHDVKPSNYQINLEKFMERKDKQENSTLRVLSLDDAASVEISQLARAMYEARKAVPAAEEENEVEAETNEKAASEAAAAKPEDGTDGATEAVAKNDNLYASFKAKNDYSKYDGLSSVQKEQKELEDYVAYLNSHTEKIDLIRDNKRITVTGEEPVDVNSPIVKAESEYGEAFNAATVDFADFGGKEDF
jgi:predicted transcriptional regulator